MEIEKEDMIIDLILNQLTDFEPGSVEFKSIKETVGDVHISKQTEILKKVERVYNLIESFKNYNNYYTLTEKGALVKKKGWAKFKGEKKRLKERDSELKQIEFDNAIAESDKLEYEKELRGLDVRLAKSNLESNEITSSNSKNSLMVAGVTMLILFVQTVWLIYSNFRDKGKDTETKKEIELLEQSIKAKEQQLSVYVYQIDSLTSLLSNQNDRIKENKELLASSKTDSKQ